jgi:2-keto-4-pentenoate hydratase/2-oxohepta-3-ene-1,7-dioic acid hydratase in catechol pathway
MRLVTFRHGRTTRLGALEDGLVRPLTPALNSSCEQLAALADAHEGRLRPAAVGVPAEDVLLLAPVPRPGKLICIGLNYHDHAAEVGMTPPESPIYFAKFSSCVIGPQEPVPIPPGSTQTDYEAELAFVIGRRARRVSVANARAHLLGWCCLNDVTARDFQFADGQWTRGKSCEGFAPMGPWIATPATVPDPHVLGIRLRLNGATMQDSSTSRLIFGVDELLAFLSEHVTLEPGDVVATGTPPGIGFARKPPVFLKPGDVMEVEVDGLGTLRNPVVGS